MVVGERIVSQASSDAFRDGYVQALGDRKPQRGRWVYDPEQKRCVPLEEYVPPMEAKNAPIMSGRCHEGQVAPDGTDIGTARKRARWMKETGIADHADFKGARAQKQRDLAERQQMLETGRPVRHDPKLRDLIGRELYKRKMIL